MCSSNILARINMKLGTHRSHRFVRCMKPIALMWQLWGKVIAPPTGNRKCVIFKMLWIHHLTFTQFASNFIRIMSKHGRCETVKGILISKILLSWQRVKPQYFFFCDFEAIRAFLGGLTWSKTLENVHTHWNPWQLGRRRGWDPCVAQRLYGAPWKTIRKLDV